MDRAARGVVVGPGQGRTVPIGPNRLAVKIGPGEGGQRFAVFESVFPPGAGAFLHRHRDYEEAFFVLDVEVEFRLDDDRVVATAGTSVFVPAGVAHGFKNVGAGDARHLVVVAPPVALEMIETLGGAHPGQVAAVLARYDSEFLGPY